MGGRGLRECIGRPFWPCRHATVVSLAVTSLDCCCIFSCCRCCSCLSLTGDGTHRLHALRIQEHVVFVIIAICMVFTGVWTVAMPLIAEFHFTCEIEDRLTGPIEISWLAIEKPG